MRWRVRYGGSPLDEKHEPTSEEQSDAHKKGREAEQCDCPVRGTAWLLLVALAEDIAAEEGLAIAVRVPSISPEHESNDPQECSADSESNHASRVLDALGGPDVGGL
jgi:hypothetical protein